LIQNAKTNQVKMHNAIDVQTFKDEEILAEKSLAARIALT